MCLVLFAWLSDQQFFRELTDINTLTKLRLKNEDQLMEELLPFGIYDDGMPEEEVIDTVPQRNMFDDNWMERNFDPF